MPQLDRPIALVSRPSAFVRGLRLIAIATITTTVFVAGLAVIVVAMTD
jgi:hypothetical protein